MREKFDIYTKMLLEWNEKMNLTAITDPEQIRVKHYLDSLSCLPYIPEGAKVADVGTGAGFPGVPVKIERDDISITLMDSLNKRINFLRELTAALGIEADCVHIRAEEAGRNTLYREKFDVTLSRAVSALPTLAEYCIPLLKVGGIMLAMKGPSVYEEIETARPLIEKLGGAEPEVFEYELSGTDLKHNIVIIKKIKPTPKTFPRNGKKVGCI